MKIIKKGPRGEYDLLESLRRAKVQNCTGAYVTDDAIAEIERLKEEVELRGNELAFANAARTNMQGTIERLTAELDEAQQEAQNYAEIIASAKLDVHAQLAEAHAALKLLHEGLFKVMHGEIDGNHPAIPSALERADQALASDGKAASDVLAAVGSWAKPDRDESAAIDLLDAWEAYRKEGRDDG